MSKEKTSGRSVFELQKIIKDKKNKHKPKENNYK